MYRRATKTSFLQAVTLASDAAEAATSCVALMKLGSKVAGSEPVYASKQIKCRS
jgi:hypothetical protein